MSQEEIQEILTDFRKSVGSITDKDVESVLKFCRRKIDITGMAEDYLKLLLPDELRNYIYRKAINTVTILTQTEKEGVLCVQCV